MLQFLLLLTLSSDAPPTKSVYRSSKTLPELERCLTDGLAKRGDVTTLYSGGYTTLVFRESKDSPAMLIDLAPPMVILKTKFSYGTRGIVKSCL
jgi:hypothetical protein